MQHIATVETLNIHIGQYTASFLAMRRLNGVQKLISVMFRHTGAPDVFGVPHMSEHEQQYILDKYRNYLVNLQRDSEHSEALRNCDIRLT